MNKLSIAVTLLTGHYAADDLMIEQACITADKLIKIFGDHQRTMTKPDYLFIENFIDQRADWLADKSKWSWMQVSRFLIDSGFDSPDKHQSAAAGIFIRQMNGDQYRKSNGKKLILCPPLK
jgi:hypothetical protein